MDIFLLIVSAAIFACVILNKLSSKLGIPVLLAFIVLGMLFGSDGIMKIPFDNFRFAEQICSFALVFIMFYGGFSTKWSEAKPSAVKAGLLSSFGTIITAMLVGLFCHYILKIKILESFLIGSVISSTDAASVFSILRSKKLNLKYNTASMLEVESGSNDPFSYMLTIIMLSLINGDASIGRFSFMLLKQLIFGAFFGVTIAFIAWLIYKKTKSLESGFDSIFIVAIAILSYAAPTFFGGNGYLSVYITGIILGNLRISDKQSLVHFFDGMTGLMQMVLFFLLGLLAFPSELPTIAPTALFIALFLTFIARPIAVFMILTPFRCKLKQQLLVSWAGLRGAASIVFAILAVTNPANIDNDIYHIVFFIVLFSILFQGTLLPVFAKLLKMIDNKNDVMRTFTDYIEEVPVEFLQCTLNAEHEWVNKKIKEIIFPPESIIVLLIRDNEKIIPKGNTILCPGDVLILSGKTADRINDVYLIEKTIARGNEWIDKTVSEISTANKLIVIIKRQGKIIIPKGSTVLQKNDIVIMNDTESKELSKV